MKKIIPLFSLIAFFLIPGCQTKVKEEAGRPNIIFIMSDDHAYQAISAYDDRLIADPEY